MVLTIFQPTLITLMLTLPRFIRSGRYGAEANGRTATRIYFFINIDSHNIVLLKKETVRKANLRA
jgi:hypothetical protein